jgi:hypothetical protein
MVLRWGQHISGVTDRGRRAGSPGQGRQLAKT